MLGILIAKELQKLHGVMDMNKRKQTITPIGMNFAIKK
jgi:hypothetical protein